MASSGVEEEFGVAQVELVGKDRSDVAGSVGHGASQDSGGFLVIQDRGSGVFVIHERHLAGGVVAAEAVDHVADVG